MDDTVHFDKIEITEEDVGCSTKTGFNKMKEIMKSCTHKRMIVLPVPRNNGRRLLLLAELIFNIIQVAC